MLVQLVTTVVGWAHEPFRLHGWQLCYVSQKENRLVRVKVCIEFNITAATLMMWERLRPSERPPGIEVRRGVWKWMNLGITGLFWGNRACRMAIMK